MIQITVDPTALTEEQRAYVANFIQDYPVATEQPVVPLAPPAPPPAHGTAGATVLPTAPEAPPAAMDNPATAFGQLAAPPAPIPPAATVVPPTGNPVPASNLDSAGMPWDARIHTSTRATVANGTWRKKRNLDPALCATVEAELRTLMGAPVPLPTPAPVPGHPPAPPAPASGGVTVDTSVLPAAPPAPVASVGAYAADINGYVALVKRITSAQADRKITSAEATQCVKDATGQAVPLIALLASRLDMVPAVGAAIDALIATRP